MPKLTFFILAAPVFLLTAAPLFAQQDSVSVQKKYNNEISFTFLGQNIIYSANYTSKLKENHKSALFQQLSFTYMKEFPKVVSYSLYREFGKRTHHLVIGLGYQYAWEKWYYEKTTYHHFNPEIMIGYSISNPERRLKIGVHLNLFFDDYRNTISLTPWGGLTLGYKFNVPPSLKILSERIPALPEKFSTEFGYEGEVGAGKLTLNGFGANSIFNVTNAAFLKYNLKHIYLKAVAGATLLSTNKLKSNEFTTTIFNNNPFFIHLGLGVGCLTATIHEWKIYPEIQAGMYVHVPDFELITESSQFESFSGFTTSNSYSGFFYSDKFYKENTPWYFKAGINSEKDLSEKWSVTLGLSYKYTMLNNKIYNTSHSYSLKSLTYSSVAFIVGLNFKL